MIKQSRNGKRGGTAQSHGRALHAASVRFMNGGSYWRYTATVERLKDSALLNGFYAEAIQEWRALKQSPEFRELSNAGRIPGQPNY